jgi:hypothetical protein
MQVIKDAILSNTHYGLKIYAFVLRKFYPGETVISLSGIDVRNTKNPYNGDAASLCIRIANGSSNHWDELDRTFVGDCFDFAQLFFKQEGDDLLKRIISSLNLETILKQRLGDIFTNWYFDKPILPSFSYYKRPISNIHPSDTITVVDVYEIIKGTYLKTETNEFRVISDKKEADKYKAKHFDYVTFSGIFTRRRDQALITHSSLLTIDFDHIENVDELKNKLLKDEFFQTELLFVSPSGNGLKWIIPIDTSEISHLEYFNAVSNYIKDTYKIEPDQKGKDVSRACFLCHDENVYINPKYIRR